MCTAPVKPERIDQSADRGANHVIRAVVGEEKNVDRRAHHVAPIEIKIDLFERGGLVGSNGESLYSK